MRFFTAATAFLAATAWASPIAEVPELLEGRDTTVVGTINASVNAIAPSLPAAVAAIEGAVNSILTATTIDARLIAQLEAAINANLGQITTGLQAATNAITSAALNSAGGVVGAVQGLTQAQIDLLAQNLQTVEDIVRGLNATVTAAASVTGSAGIAIRGELTALRNAISPFLSPILAFANAAVSLSTGVTVNGLQNAVQGVETIVNRVLASLGLGQLGSLIATLLKSLGLIRS